MAPRRAHSRNLLLAALLLLAVAVPLEVGDGRANASVALTAILCVVWMLRMILLRRAVVLERSLAVTATLAFMGVALLSFVVGQYPWYPTAPAPMEAQVSGLAVFLLSGGLFLLVGHRLRSLADLEWLTWLFVAVGAAQVVMMFLPYDLKASSIAVTNVRTVGSLFWVWLVAITFSQAFFNSALSPINRIGLAAVGLFAFSWAFGVSIDWSSGWLPSLVALGIVCLFRFPRFTIGAALLLAAPAVMMSAAAWDSLMGNESWSWMTRVEAAVVMFDVVEANPWLGFGPANYRNYTKLFPILGYNLRFNSHNNYLDLLAQTGVVGLIAFGWFAFELFRLALALYRRVPPGFARAYVVGAIAGLTGSLLAGLLADWVVPFVYNIGLPGFRSSLLFWFFLGGLLAIKRIMASSHELRGAPANVRGIDSRVGLRPAPMWARHTSTWSGFGD